MTEKKILVDSSQLSIGDAGALKCQLVFTRKFGNTIEERTLAVNTFNILRELNKFLGEVEKK